MAGIRLVVFDFDGVFTDGKFYFGQDQEPRKAYNGRDSYGLKKLRSNNVEVGIITNDVSVSLENTAHIYITESGSSAPLRNKISSMF